MNTVEANMSLISKVPLFASLPSNEIAQLATTLRPFGYDADTTLFLEGDHGDRFYIVLKGEIAIIKAMGTDDERLLGLRGPGEFVGEMSLLNRDGLRTASARVYHDTQVLELTRSDFDQLLHRHPSLAYEMLRVMSTRLRESHESSMRDLHEKNRHLAQAYADLQTAQARIIAQETLARELDLAREIQESMLPSALPHSPGLDMGACMVPALQVGGDFYDIFQIDDDTFGIVVGDVSGKGMPAALFMALTCSLVRAEAIRAESPEAAIQSVNHHLLTRNAKGMFVTLLYGVLHLPTRTIKFVRAGHELPLIYDEYGEKVPVARERGHPLALFPQPSLDTQMVMLPRNATLLMYSDGATDARDELGDLFELDRLQDALYANLSGSAQAICDGVVQILTDYHGAAPQADDITLVAVRVH